jgi:hypothetical protein
MYNLCYLLLIDLTLIVLLCSWLWLLSSSSVWFNDILFLLTLSLVTLFITLGDLPLMTYTSWRIITIILDSHVAFILLYPEIKLFLLNLLISMIKFTDWLKIKHRSEVFSSMLAYNISNCKVTFAVRQIFHNPKLWRVYFSTLDLWGSQILWCVSSSVNKWTIVVYVL